MRDRNPNNPKAAWSSPRRRHPAAVQLWQRRSVVLKDRRQGRGGAANRQQQWLALYREEITVFQESNSHEQR
jgi:hypothetical protein